MIFIKLLGKVLPLGIKEVRGDHASRDWCLRMGVKTPGGSTTPPTSQPLHRCLRETGASTHTLLPTTDKWRLLGKDQGPPPLQHPEEWWEGYSAIADTAGRDWATESRTNLLNPYHTHTAFHTTFYPNLWLHLYQPYTTNIANLYCIWTTSTLQLCWD